MGIRPYRTLKLRLFLRFQKHRNARSKSRVPQLHAKYSAWNDLTPVAHPSATVGAWIHPYPGLGHQLSGWIAGYLWAKDLGIPYRGGAITRDESGMFAFPTQELATVTGQRLRRMQLACVNNEKDPLSLPALRGQLNKALVEHPEANLEFQFALDQPRWDQVAAEHVVREAVLAGSQGAKLASLEVLEDKYIALHIRRGDVSSSTPGGSGNASRWTSESWYVTLVRQLRKHPALKDLPVRAYALGTPADFPELIAENIQLHLGGHRDDDFIALCAARVLVVAPSSFSFFAGLASKNVVIAQSPWWHRVPNDGRWIAASSDGDLSQGDLIRALSSTWERE